MTPAMLTPLAWPPPTDPQPRWAHQALHTIADIHQRTWAAHQQLTSLRATLADHPPAPGELAPRLRAIANTAADPNDHARLHQLLDRHGHHHVTGLLHRAGRHRGDALRTLRRLTQDDQRHLLDPASAVARLDQAGTDLTAAGPLLVRADRALITALETTPTQGGDCYPT